MERLIAVSFLCLWCLSATAQQAQQPQQQQPMPAMPGMNMNRSPAELAEDLRQMKEHEQQKAKARRERWKGNYESGLCSRVSQWVIDHPKNDAAYKPNDMAADTKGKPVLVERGYNENLVVGCFLQPWANVDEQAEYRKSYAAIRKDPQAVQEAARSVLAYGLKAPEPPKKQAQK